jgi:hypothetical protein
VRQVCYYDPAEREREKERHRALDESRLHDGEVSRQELRERNSFLSSLEIVDSSIVCREVFA